MAIRALLFLALVGAAAAFGGSMTMKTPDSLVCTEGCTFDEIKMMPEAYHTGTCDPEDCWNPIWDFFSDLRNAVLQEVEDAYTAQATQAPPPIFYSWNMNAILPAGNNGTGGFIQRGTPTRTMPFPPNPTAFWNTLRTEMSQTGGFLAPDRGIIHARITFYPSSRLITHYHYNSINEYGFILSGRLYVVVTEILGDGVYRMVLEEGDMFYLPEGSTHFFVNLLEPYCEAPWGDKAHYEGLAWYLGFYTPERWVFPADVMGTCETIIHFVITTTNVQYTQDAMAGQYFGVRTLDGPMGPFEVGSAYQRTVWSQAFNVPESVWDKFYDAYPMDDGSFIGPVPGVVYPPLVMDADLSVFNDPQFRFEYYADENLFLGDPVYGGLRIPEGDHLASVKYYDSGLFVAVTRIEPGCLWMPHWHFDELHESGVVLQGELMVGVWGFAPAEPMYDLPVTQGEMFYIPEGKQHYIKNTGMTTLQILHYWTAARDSVNMAGSDHEEWGPRQTHFENTFAYGTGSVLDRFHLQREDNYSQYMFMLHVDEDTVKEVGGAPFVGHQIIGPNPYGEDCAMYGACMTYVPMDPCNTMGQC